MAFESKVYEAALLRAAAHARDWLDSVSTRKVGPRVKADELVKAFGGPFPLEGMPADEVVDLLARVSEPGLMASGSGRFYGWVMGGILPAALGADWLVSAWDQNTGLRYATPATAAAEEVAGAWLLEALGLPASAEVGFVTGGTMANFTGLAAGRSAVLAKAGWDFAKDGLFGAPRIRVIVGEERHDTIDVALRYLGLGSPERVAADSQGRLGLDALEAALATVKPGSPLIVCLQAGNLHSGAFDPLGDAITLAHQHGAWVHVDGAFGLWAAAAPSLRHLTRGYEHADSWGTDAHKTLNVPYDCGIAIVADKHAMRAAFGVHTSYLITEEAAPADPLDKVPELSRRARGVPVWAALRSLGRKGVGELVERLVRNAHALAEGFAKLDGVTVMNEVPYTQICLSFGSEERTRAVTASLIADGTAWMSGSRWKGRNVLRVSVSNWSTDANDVAMSIEAVRRAMAATRF